MPIRAVIVETVNVCEVCGEVKNQPRTVFKQFSSNTALTYSKTRNCRSRWGQILSGWDSWAGTSVSKSKLETGQSCCPCRGKSQVPDSKLSSSLPSPLFPQQFLKDLVVSSSVRALEHKLFSIPQRQSYNISGVPPTETPKSRSGVLLTPCCSQRHRTAGKATLPWLFLSVCRLLFKEGKVIMWSQKLLQAVCNVLKPDPIYTVLNVSLTKASIGQV